MRTRISGTSHRALGLFEPHGLQQGIHVAARHRGVFNPQGSADVYEQDDVRVVQAAQGAHHPNGSEGEAILL